MVYLTIQVALLLLIAFILGAILGCLLRYLLGGTRDAERVEPAGSSRASATTATATNAAAVSAARVPHMPTVPRPVPQPLVMPDPVEPEVADTPVATTPPPLKAAPAEKRIETPAAEPKTSAKPDTTGKERAGTRARPDAKAKADTKAKPVANAKSRAKAEPVAKGTTPAGDPTGASDNLKLIRGIGPQNESRLNGIGVYQFAQIAKWSKKDQREIGERLSFPGRIEREEWVSQAKRLAKGGSTEFSNRASAGRVKTSAGAAAPAVAGTKPATLDAPRDDKTDSLTLIDGVGNAIEKKLFKMGIYHFDQVAGWSDDEAHWVGNELGFPGRVQRENWVAEAAVFAAGGTRDQARPAERGQIRTSRKADGDER